MLWEDTPAPRMVVPPGDCAGRCVVEMDDGNGMWITTGVSRDLCTCLHDGVSRRTTPPEPILPYDTPLFDRALAHALTRRDRHPANQPRD